MKIEDMEIAAVDRTWFWQLTAKPRQMLTSDSTPPQDKRRAIQARKGGVSSYKERQKLKSHIRV